MDREKVAIRMEREQIYRITNSGKIIPVGELVRCKDCEYGEKCVEPHLDYWCNLYEAYKYQNWYCADGVRKDD